MSTLFGDGSHPAWRKFLAIGELLIRQTTIKDQAELIRSNVESINNYEVDVWFRDVIAKVPGAIGGSIFPPNPSTPLMQKTYSDHKICIIGKSGNPKQYSGNEAPYVISFPLIVQDDLLGIIQVVRSDSQSFSHEEVDFLEGYCAHIAVGLQISHQTIIKNWRLEQLSLVRAVSEQISSITDLDELCKTVTCYIRSTFHYYAVSIYTIPAGKNQLHFRASNYHAGPADDIDTILNAQIGKGIIGHVAKTGKEVVANDVSREKRFISMEQLPLTKSEAVLPLCVEDRVLGVLDIQSEHLYAFHDMDMLVLRSLAASIALAVESVQLINDIERRAEQLSVVSEVGRALSSILDFDQLLNEIVTLIKDRFGYPFVHLFLCQKESGQLVYRAGAGDRAVVLDKTGLSYGLQDNAGMIPWVARKGATLIANDVTQEPHYRPSSIFPMDTASEMVVPLKVGGDVLGVLDIQSDQANRFDDSDRILFEALGDSIAIAIRNSILFNSEKWRRQAADSLREVASLLSTNIAIDTLMDIILTRLENILPCDASAIWLVEAGSEERTLTLAAAHGIGMNKITESCCQHPICLEWLDRALVQNHPTVRTALDPAGPLGLSLELDKDYSSIATPMMIDGKPVGLLTLAHHSPQKYGIESIHLTSAFASYAAVAIQNARLYSTAQEQAWIATVLLQVAEATQSISNIDELLEAVVRLTPMLVGVTGFGLFIWEPAMSAFSVAGKQGINLHSSDTESLHWLTPEQAPGLLKVLETRRQILIQDPSAEFPAWDPGEMPEDQHSTLLPLLSRGNVMGVCMVTYHDTKISGSSVLLEKERLAIIQGITHQTAIAVENIRLLESQQQETYVSAVLLQVAQTVVSNSNLDDVFDSIVHVVPILVGSETCMIILWDHERGEYIVSSMAGSNHQLEESMFQHRFPVSSSQALQLITSQDKLIALPIDPDEVNNPLAYFNLDTSNLINPMDLNRINSPLLLGIPLSVKGDIYGAMLVVDPGKDRIYLQKRLEILTGIAQQTSLAIQNERLQIALVSREKLEREFQLAREIQQTFLPNELPKPIGWEVDVRWRPARDVGGDFYDIFHLPNHHLAIVIADVSDKGISAALYMTLTRTLLRTVAQQHGSPAKILSSVNELLLRDTPHGMFVTAMLGILDVNSGKLIYANAGHNLPLIRRAADNKIEALFKGSMPLGILEKLAIHDQETQILAGDTLLLFTDGVTDAYAGNELFGDARLHKAMLEAKSPDARSILTAIDLALMNFSGSDEPADDVTEMAIHRSKNIIL